MLPLSRQLVSLNVLNEQLAAMSALDFIELQLRLVLRLEIVRASRRPWLRFLGVSGLKIIDLASTRSSTQSFIDFSIPAGMGPHATFLSNSNGLQSGTGQILDLTTHSTQTYSLCYASSRASISPKGTLA